MIILTPENFTLTKEEGASVHQERFWISESPLVTPSGLPGNQDRSKPLAAPSSDTSSDDYISFEGDCLTYPALSEKYRPVGLAPGQTDLYGEVPEVLTAVLPGHGLPGDGCGEGVAYYCNHCGKSFWIRRSCMMRECPECHEKWAAKEGKAAAWRLWTGIQHLYRGYPVRILHCMVSMEYNGQSLEELRGRAKLVARNHGITGALQVLHPFRKNDEGQYASDGTVHFHVIGIAPGNVIPGGLKSDGTAIFKVIPDPGSEARGKATYRGFRRFGDVKRAVQYLLSHCGIIEGRHSLTWWGSLGYNSLSTEKLKEFCPAGYANLTEYKAKVCPFCGSDDTEPCEELDLVPKVGVHQDFDRGSDWRWLEVHPMPDEPRPLPYAGADPKQSGEKEWF